MDRAKIVERRQPSWGAVFFCRKMVNEKWHWLDSAVQGHIAEAFTNCAMRENPTCGACSQPFTDTR